MQNKLNFTFTNTISLPNYIYHKYTLISFLQYSQKHKMYITEIFTSTRNITIVHVQMKLNHSTENEKMLHPSSHHMKNQSFPVVKKMMHSLQKGHSLHSNVCSLSELKYHLNIHPVLKKLYKMKTTTILTYPYGKVNWPIRLTTITWNQNRQNKILITTERKNLYHLFLRLMGHTLSSSQLCHCHLCKYSYILVLIKYF